MQVSQVNEPILLTIEETMKKLRVGRSKLYRMMENEGLPVFRSGRYVRIPSDLLQQWINERPREAADRKYGDPLGDTEGIFCYRK